MSRTPISVLLLLNGDFAALPFYLTYRLSLYTVCTLYFRFNFTLRTLRRTSNNRSRKFLIAGRSMADLRENSDMYYNDFSTIISFTLHISALLLQYYRYIYIYPSKQYTWQCFIEIQYPFTSFGAFTNISAVASLRHSGFFYLFLYLSYLLLTFLSLP